MWTNRVALGTTLACSLWSLSFVLFGGTSRGKERIAEIASRFFRDVKGGVPVMALTIPVLTAGSVCMLLLLRDRINYVTRRARPRQLPACVQRLVQNYRSGQGDWNYNNFAITFILFPCTMFLLGSVYRHLHGHEMGLDDKLMEIGNSFGIMALVAMSFFLIPVSRHSPVLKLLGWGQAHVVTLHIWSGRIILVGVVVHGVMHMFRWLQISGESLGTMLLPPTQCFRRDTDFEPTCNDSDTDCSCYDLMRNLTGFLAMVFLLVIGATSLNYVRRKFYKVFYMAHVIAGPLMLIMTILHWNRSILYISPSLLYYVASSMPVMVESWRKCRRDGGVRILSVKAIRGSGGRSLQRPCVSVTFQASNAAMERYSPGQYIKLLAPSVSSIYHPFTINMVPGKPNQVRIIFRVTGSFTTQLARSLLSSRRQNQDTEPLPIVHLDGYHGTQYRLDHILRHDVVVMVAGGIGITPYLSMLLATHSILSARQHSVTREVVLHWLCRDDSLVEYVKQEYFDFLLNQQDETASRDFRIRLVVHKTRHLEGREDMHVATSYSDLENPQDVTTNDEDELGLELGLDEESTSVQEDNGEDDVEVGRVTFTQSRFAAGSKSQFLMNLLPFTGFASIAWLGLGLIWFLYSTVQEKHAVASRIWGAVALVVVGFAGSLAVNLVMDFTSDQEERDAQYTSMLDSTTANQGSSWWWTQADAEEEDNDSTGSDERGGIELETMTGGDDLESPDSRFTSVEEDADKGAVVTYEEREGRPTVHQLLKSVDGSRCPALFSCGPSKLMQELRDAADVQCAMRIQHCICGTPHISLYEEAFEM